jgi:Protein of unknown function (DUF3570)
MRLQVTHMLALATAITAAVSLAPRPIHAGGVQDPTASYTFNYYTDVKGVTVRSQYTNTSMMFPRDFLMSLQWVHDVVVFPAIDAPPGSQEAVDAITTASRPISTTSDPYTDYVKVRNSMEGSLKHGDYTTGYYVSKESDYFAQMVSGSANHNVMDDNLNVAADVSYSWDSITPLNDSDTSTLPDYRRTLHLGLVATQIATPTMVVRAGAEYNQVHGLQHDPYRNVYVAGTNVPENAPNDRHREAVFVDLSQYITNRSSVKLDYRYYTDDWGVSSNTFGIKLNQYVTDDLIVRYRYRYYTQGPATFYRADYTEPGGVNGFQTNDYRLGDFSAHLFGGHVTWRPYGAIGGPHFMSGLQVILNYERYFNSNNFSASIIETGLQIAF